MVPAHTHLSSLGIYRRLQQSVYSWTHKHACSLSQNELSVRHFFIFRWWWGGKTVQPAGKVQAIVKSWVMMCSSAAIEKKIEEAHHRGHKLLESIAPHAVWTTHIKTVNNTTRLLLCSFLSCGWTERPPQGILTSLIEIWPRFSIQL
jgi:hypothetical protein